MVLFLTSFLVKCLLCFNFSNMSLTVPFVNFCSSKLCALVPPCMMLNCMSVPEFKSVQLCNGLGVYNRPWKWREDIWLWYKWCKIFCWCILESHIQGSINTICCIHLLEECGNLYLMLQVNKQSHTNRMTNRTDLLHSGSTNSKHEKMGFNYYCFSLTLLLKHIFLCLEVMSFS